MSAGPDAAFLQGIIADPDDDGPRLVYADWLEERGDPRGEFIRAQYTLAQPGVKDPDRVEEWCQREEQLLKEHRAEWLRPFKGLGKGCTFRRGFVEEVTLPARSFLRKAARLAELTPLRVVHLTKADGCGAAVAALPVVARLTQLDLQGGGWLMDEDAIPLAESPHVAGLTRLAFTNSVADDGTMIGDEGVAALAASKYLRRLQALGLKGNDIGDQGLVALAGSPCLTRLRDLDLSNVGPEFGRNAVTESGVRALAASATLAQLQQLDLSYTSLDDDAVCVLARAPRFANLRSLRLWGNQIAGRGAVALLQSAFVARWRELDLSESQLGDGGVSQLAQFPALARLKSLVLAGLRPR